jgi:hypothetical protein
MNTAVAILRGGESLLEIVARAQALPAPWGLVLSAVSAGMGLAADLAANGVDPVSRIERMRSAAQAFRRVDDRHDAELDRLASLGPPGPGGVEP